MKTFYFISVVVFTFYSCKNTADNNINNELTRKELELKERELVIKEKELEQKDKEIKVLKELVEELLKKETPTKKAIEDPGYFPGSYPQASSRLLDYSDLYDLSAWDLKIIRNEIYARHGLIFQTDEMNNYFSNQSWYEPRYTDVNSMLTKIESQNINLIKRFER